MLINKFKILCMTWSPHVLGSTTTFVNSLNNSLTKKNFQVWLIEKLILSWSSGYKIKRLITNK